MNKFAMNQLEKNEGSNYEGVVAEQMSAFFSSYYQANKKSTMSPVKVMRLLELMNPQFKSFFKRDPFDMLLCLINGLH